MNLNDLSERQSRTILERIHFQERNLVHLVDAVSALARKKARSREKSDDLAKILKQISEDEKFNKTSAKALESFSNGLSLLADHETLEIRRLEERIVSDLNQQQQICQSAKEEVKSQLAIRDRELSKRKQLDLNRKLKNENEIILSNMQIAKVLKEIMTVSEQFEDHKVTDTKEVLTNFVLIELKHHAACLEILTAIYNDIDEIDEKKDVEGFSMQLKKINRQFKKHFQHEVKPNSGFFLNRIKSQSLGALSSILEKKPMREKSSTRRDLKTLNKSAMSLNSLESNDEEEIRNESLPQNISIDSLETKSSDTEDSDTESESASKEQEVLQPRQKRVS